MTKLPQCAMMIISPTLIDIFNFSLLLSVSYVFKNAHADAVNLIVCVLHNTPYIMSTNDLYIKLVVNLREIQILEFFVMF